VRGLTDQVTTDWHVYRSAKPLLDPETRKPIAYEAIVVGGRVSSGAATRRPSASWRPRGDRRPATA
jgi:hypothetical protein